MLYPEALRTEVQAFFISGEIDPDMYIEYMRNLTNVEYVELVEDYFEDDNKTLFSEHIVLWLLKHDALVQYGEIHRILSRERLYELGKALTLSRDPEACWQGALMMLRHHSALPNEKIEQVSLDFLNVADGPHTHLHGNPFTCTLLRKYDVPAVIAMRVPFDSPDDEPCACRLHKMKRAVSPVVPA